MKKSDQTKAKILSAALDEFAAKGFAGTRVDQIAQAAGVNKAMIYYFFTGKEELLKELFQSEMEQLKTELGALMAQRDVHSREEISQAVRALLAYASSKKKLLQVLIAGAIQDETIQPYLFRLLDFSSAAGIEFAQPTTRISPESTREEVLHELFTGLLPLIYFVLLRDGLSAYYAWDEETLTQHFIARFLQQHAGYE